jgi:hypothetical protein
MKNFTLVSWRCQGNPTVTRCRQNWRRSGAVVLVVIDGDWFHHLCGCIFRYSAPPVQRRHVDAQFPHPVWCTWRPSATASGRSRRAGHADGAAQADLRVLLSILLKTRSGSNLRGRIDPRYIPGVTGPLLQRSASCSTESNRLHSTCIEPVTEEEQPAARTGDEASG